MTALPLDPPIDIRRPGPVDLVRNSLTLAWRNLVQVKHNPAEIFDFSVQPIVFVLLFVYVFGGQMLGSVDMAMQFFLPGVIVQNALFITMGTSLGLNTDIEKGLYDRLRSLPIARSVPLVGRILADAVKQLWSLVLILGFGLILGFEPTGGFVGVLGTAGVLLAVALLLSWVGVFLGVAARNAEQVQVLNFVIVLPLTLTSGAFVKVETMPHWLQVVVHINPVTSIAGACRGLLVGGPVQGPLLISLLWSAGLAVVFGTLAVTTLKRRV